MKRLVLFCLFLLCGYASSKAQAPILPRGFTLQPAPSGEPGFVRYDFDGDGKIDVFCAAAKEGEEDARLMALLKRGNRVLKSGTLSMCCGVISQKGGVVQVQSRGMRGFSYYKFRWDKSAKDFRLIGYDTESFGNAAGDGSGKSSLNLLTGAYAGSFHKWSAGRRKLLPQPAIRSTKPLSKRIYLSSFGEAEDAWLAELSASYLPKSMR